MSLSLSDKTTRARLTTLIGAIVVEVASGSNYAFSAYGPQLGSRLKLSQTRLNILALCGNCGSYLSGPFVGRLIDTHGPQPSFVVAFACLFLGYSGVRLGFDHSRPNEQLSDIIFWAIALCFFLTGVGSNAGTSSAMNATAKSVPPHLYSTMTGIVMAGYGISSFVFSAIAGSLFPGQTSSLLLVLSLGTSIPMVIGYCFVKPVPVVANDESTRPLLEHSNDNRTLHSDRVHVERNVYGMALFRTMDFWLFVLVLVFLTGTGLTFINNIGTITQTLYRYKTGAFDPAESARMQAVQVSFISVFNCFGRLLLGTSTDTMLAYFSIPRSSGLTIVSSLMLASQLIAWATVDPEKLWMSSALLGAAYGGIFGAWAGLLIGWFGISHYSENSAYANLSPVIGGNLFNLIFGLVFDSHVRSTKAHDPGACLLGRECYAAALQITSVACCAALTIGLWIVRRDVLHRRLELG